MKIQLSWPTQPCEFRLSVTPGWRGKLRTSASPFARGWKLALLVLFLAAAAPLFAKTTGAISGTARDPQGAVVPNTTVLLRNVQTGITQTANTDDAGFYSFPAVEVGTYEVTFQKPGFAELKVNNLVIDVDTSRQVDADLKVGGNQEKVTVNSTAAHVDTETNQIGEVIGQKEMTDLPLNGRAFTDLLALQPGVVPISTSQYGDLLPANYLNNGLLSMGGARDVNSGFMVNGANVVEGFGAGTTVVPNLDSIGEFRIITSNAGAEYGNYAGGQVNVVTKSGTNSWHGDVFEFLRNTDLDAKNFFSADRGIFHQNQFGGTFGGPILRDKAFFFVDYQGTRQHIGVDTGDIRVPTVAEKSGDFSSTADANQLASGCEDGNGNSIPCTVKGSYWAGQLTNRLGYTVTADEPYYTSGCTSTSQCVFPNAMVPKAAWDPVSPNLLPLFPAPTAGVDFETSAYPETLQEDKGGLRIDVNTRFGMVSGYYFDDPWNNISPYDGSDGANLPGFPDAQVGNAKLATLELTTVFGKSSTNIFTASFFRNKDLYGSTVSGPSLSSLGFASPQNNGIDELTPQYQNYPTVILYGGSTTVGPPESRMTQLNDTYQFQDDFTRIIGSHTLKFGADYHWDLIDFSRSNMKLYFKFNGKETGAPFADLLLGAPSSYFQATPASVPLRNFYVGAYGEDSWRVTRNFTLNYGLRWDVDPYWASATDNEPVFVAGEQSVKFPTAPLGYDFPGDPGIPHHQANIRWNDFAPRLGLAYSPDVSSGFLHSIFGDHGKSSIRAGYGLYYTNIEGSAVYSFSAPPYGYHYSSPAPPILSMPFVNRTNGMSNGQRFPIAPVTSPNSIMWSQFEPISGMRSPLVDSPSPYTEHVDLSFQRQLAANTVWTISYVGTFGHHLILNTDNNPGNQALCLSLSDPSEVTDGNTCGPDLENGTFRPVGGGVVNGTRAPYGNNFTGNGLQIDVGNSSYHGLETTLRQNAGRLSFLLSYTYSKAIDDGSGFGEQIVIYPNGQVFAPRALSLYDIPENFSASYTVELPFDMLFRKNNQLTRGWKISGISEFTTGLPVTMFEIDDNCLLGSDNNSGYTSSPDEPTYTPGKNIYQDRNPRDNQLKDNSNGDPQYAWFNVNLFSEEPLGQIGNSSRRFFFGPGTDNWDMSLLKDVRIAESKSFEFRAEFFNIFNHAQFQGTFSPDGNLSDGPGAFGFVTSAADPRIGQMGLKFLF